jgi:putative FmdB family regulatory protein
MPIYEYACTACGYRFDVRQSFSDEPIASCPNCGAPVRRVLHPAGVIFKGSGWYKTDSRASVGKSEAGDASSSETSSESKKPDTKAASKKEPVKSAADD